MGFTDLVSDAGLAGKWLPAAAVARPANRDSVLNVWLTTRSYIIGWVCLLLSSLPCFPSPSSSLWDPVMIHMVRVTEAASRPAT